MSEKRLKLIKLLHGVESISLQESSALLDEFEASIRNDPNDSIRDMFAAAALTALIIHPQLSSTKPAEFAEFSYQQADAMMAERLKYTEDQS